LGALISRTRVTTDALLREAQRDAAAGHERHSAGEPSSLWSSGPCAINILLLTTEIKQCAPFSPSHNCSFELEITFCVRGVVSPALANCALDGLERLLREKYPAGKRLKSLGGEKPCVNLVRYADDFVITSKSEELLEGEIKPLVEHFLQERGLELSPTKTVITHLEHGFDFVA